MSAQHVPDQLPMAEPSRRIDLAWVKQMMVAEYNARDWREANELALLALMEIQEHWGYCPEEAAAIVADHLGIELQRTYHLLTFYADLRTTPRADNVYTICDGAACHTLGSGALHEQIYQRLGITQRGQTSADGQITVEVWSGCMGACQIGPMANVNGKYHGHLTAAKVDRILDELQGRDPRGSAQHAGADTAPGGETDGRPQSLR